MISWKHCEDGAKLCKENSKRLINAAGAILQVKYSTPHGIPTSYITDMKYSSCCGLIILGIEEIGKGFFLLQKYQNKRNVSDAEWDRLTKRNAHQNKIRYAKGLLGPTNTSQIRELNRIKFRDIYVDWDNSWKSPMDLQKAAKNQKQQNLLDLANLLLEEFEKRF